jgi:hypothetical protein
MTEGADANGRPIAYVFAQSNMPAGGDGDWLAVTQTVYEPSLNATMVRQGHAYPTLYTSTAAPAQRLFARDGSVAREKGLGVWALDHTLDFELVEQSSIDEHSQVTILPKLFRRCTDYLQQKFPGTLEEWLRSKASGPRPEDDRVVIKSSGFETSFSELVETINSRVTLKADPLDIVFVEK